LGWWKPPPIFFKKLAGKNTDEGLMKFLRTPPKTALKLEHTL
jgi:hypothetical protein